MPNITITSVVFPDTPANNQTVTIKYRLTSDPDVPGSYTTVTTTAIATPAGTLTSPVTISGLAFNTQYTVYITNNCGGSGYKKNFTTPYPSCPDISDIVGTTSE